MAGLAGGVALAGCSGRPRGVRAVPDALLVDTARGLAVLRGNRCAVAGVAVVAPDATTIYATVPAPGGTRLETIATDSGTVAASTVLPDAWEPRIVSPDGRLVALVPPGHGAGREHSTILVADGSGVRHRLELAGNVVPDAFGEAGTTMFVLDWLPPAAPDRYRVRAVDLASGKPGPLLTRTKVPVPPGAEEEMRGTARQAVFSPDLATLYTLYTNQPDHWHTRDLIAGHKAAETPAFVHTLSLAVGWAYCVDLPEPFGRGAAAGHAQAIAPDGSVLLVADCTSGHVAAVDTESLAVRRVAALPAATGTASAAVAPDGERLYVGAGQRVYVVAVATLAVAGEWSLPAAARGMAVSKDGSRLLIGHSGAVSWLDAASGRQLGQVPVAGLTQVRRVA